MAASFQPRLLHHLEHLFAKVRKGHDKHLWVREFQLALESEARGATPEFVEKDVLRLRPPLETRLLWRDVGVASRTAWEAAALQVYRDVYRAVFAAPEAIADHFLPADGGCRRRAGDSPSLDEVVDRAVRRSIKSSTSPPTHVGGDVDAVAQVGPVVDDEQEDDTPEISPFIQRKLAKIAARSPAAQAPVSASPDEYSEW
jgi:hypothetical protein